MEEFRFISFTIYIYIRTRRKCPVKFRCLLVFLLFKIIDCKIGGTKYEKRRRRRKGQKIVEHYVKTTLCACCRGNSII